VGRKLLMNKERKKTNYLTRELCEGTERKKTKGGKIDLWSANRAGTSFIVRRRRATLKKRIQGGGGQRDHPYFWLSNQMNEECGVLKSLLIAPGRKAERRKE